MNQNPFQSAEEHLVWACPLLQVACFPKRSHDSKPANQDSLVPFLPLYFLAFIFLFFLFFLWGWGVSRVDFIIKFSYPYIYIYVHTRKVIVNAQTSHFSRVYERLWWITLVPYPQFIGVVDSRDIYIHIYAKLKVKNKITVKIFDQEC